MYTITQLRHGVYTCKCNNNNNNNNFKLRNYKLIFLCFYINIQSRFNFNSISYKYGIKCERFICVMYYHFFFPSTDAFLITLYLYIDTQYIQCISRYMHHQDGACLTIYCMCGSFDVLNYISPEVKNQRSVLNIDYDFFFWVFRDGIKFCKNN